MNLVSHLTMQAEQSLNRAASQVRQARSLPEVVRSMNPSLPPQVRPLVRSLPSYRNFQFALEQAAERLVKAQLEAVVKANEPERSLLLQRYQHQEWICLRGNFPRLASHVDRQIQVLRNETQRPRREEADRSSAPNPR
ncbi:hypothetical protein [Achromobacter sp. 2789STDY5608633]|uniref:hypothetical protein n=1 Tax=Achromobacter sp. 2789STDY5608633 TaxID=1806501 RepID=UPI0012E0C879|nr:hypothetical protein [Achromobacter sp. 2789STDY5608633]